MALKGHEPAHAFTRFTSRAHQAADELTPDSREEFILCGVTLGVTFVLA